MHLDFPWGCIIACWLSQPSLEFFYLLHFLLVSISWLIDTAHESRHLPETQYLIDNADNGKPASRTGQEPSKTATRDEPSVTPKQTELSMTTSSTATSTASRLSRSKPRLSTAQARNQEPLTPNRRTALASTTKPSPRSVAGQLTPAAAVGTPDQRDIRDKTPVLVKKPAVTSGQEDLSSSGKENLETPRFGRTPKPINPHIQVSVSRCMVIVIKKLSLLCLVSVSIIGHQCYCIK